MSASGANQQDEVKEQATLGGTIFGYSLIREEYSYDIGEGGGDGKIDLKHHLPAAPAT